MRTTHLTLAAATLSAASLALVACGGDTDDPPTAAPESTAGTDGTFPVDVLSGPLDGGEEVTVEARPEAVVSLSPTATEMLFAVGAGDQVVAVDDQSDFPEGVPVTDLSGYTPNVEAVLGYGPDLVVTSSDDADVIAGLEAAAVPVLVLPSATDLDEAYSQIERVGAATGHVGEAAEVVGQMQTDIEAAVASAEQVGTGGGEALTYFHELDPTLFTATSDTFIGEVYGLFGLENVADAVGDGDPYPQLSAEYVVEADPDLVFLADGECCQVTPEAVAQRAGWADLAAVQAGQVTAVDEDVASRWGPRVVEFARTVGEIVATARVPAG